MRHGHMDEQGKWKMKLTERRTTQGLTGEGRTERGERSRDEEKGRDSDLLLDYMGCRSGMRRRRRRRKRRRRTWRRRNITT